VSERDDDRARIRAVIDTINGAWSKGTADDLPRLMDGCFHDKAVFRDRDFRLVANGAAACIASYQSFVREATIEAFRMGEPTIDLAGETAIAAYPWNVAYTMGGERHDEEGYDVFVLMQDEAARWFVRWRTILTR
jgi:hypothetical protein